MVILLTNCLTNFFAKTAQIEWCLFYNRWELSNVPFYAVLNFQDPATPIMEAIINLHHDIFFIITWVVFFILYLLCIILSQSVIREPGVGDDYTDRPWELDEFLTYYHRKGESERILYYIWQEIEKTKNKKICYFEPFVCHETSYDVTLEILWTLIPGLILITIALPSFALLYAIDEMVEPALTLHVMGHQWYWSYGYDVFNKFIAFDSYMIPDSALSLGAFRLLEVDNRLILPTNTHIRALVTAQDVLHSWALPAFGVKIDACPGRLNLTQLYIKRAGVFYGQCSEICGRNHAFMPIVVEAVDMYEFIKWCLNVK